MGEANCQKYGVPLYGAAWVLLRDLYNKKNHPQKQEEEKEEKKSEPAEKIINKNSWLVLSGGGGAGSSGIPNSLLLTQFDSSSNSLSETPVARHGTGNLLPYRMAVHPGGDGLICAFPESCRWFEWNVPTSMETNDLGLRASEGVLTELEDVGQQLALAFNKEGSELAVGSEDGHLRVFKWPSMALVIDKADAHPTLKDLDFSLDGRFLVSLGGGPCRIWDVETATVVASLLRENDEVFTSCRFSVNGNGTQILYITAMRDRGGSIVSFDTSSWTRVSSKNLVRDPISAFNVSPDGEHLAIGTIQGDVFVYKSSNTRVASIIKKAHLGLVTALKFSEDSRLLVSASMDSSVRVTKVEEDTTLKGLTILVFVLQGFWFIMMIAIIFLLAYYHWNDKPLPFAY
ncbi:SEC12-like protein 2 [Papaver somniferum]|uniref:SEC12-like protein 2 n=1 Tax=Papaver somniferum TaxID=3469 RepID=UPI000E6FF77E|nr:SEC12-like protein 2 [Papaver somniferum]